MREVGTLPFPGAALASAEVILSLEGNFSVAGGALKHQGGGYEDRPPRISPDSGSGIGLLHPELRKRKRPPAAIHHHQCNYYRRADSARRNRHFFGFAYHGDSAPGLLVR
ncbi:hypothetical protein SBA1_630030 [Candidatus Sulfotelmatobacter kueseliae]|uniref:Uncharacterized protein n=1 Tax=Candidatus Sulfotelmatobacter kueseliae TaxID=2042962 RepID=A0A2U3L2F4_9BACT|nr:hypothetical protein SBA1_630030 [Candidatus Sulfotelmatobacter kueseliae]